MKIRPNPLYPSERGFFRSPPYIEHDAEVRRIRFKIQRNGSIMGKKVA